MFFASLCHDLDHRGRTNSWMKNEQTPLAAVYSTSTMEHHHFNQTITILQVCRNVFASLILQQAFFVRICIAGLCMAAVHTVVHAINQWTTFSIVLSQIVEPPQSSPYPSPRGWKYNRG